MHSDFSYDALRAHRRGRGDNSKIDIFLLVTTRLIAHSGQSEFFQIVLVSLAWTLGSPW